MGGRGYSDESRGVSGEGYSSKSRGGQLSGGGRVKW